MPLVLDRVKAPSNSTTSGQAECTREQDTLDHQRWCSAHSRNSRDVFGHKCTCTAMCSITSEGDL